MNIIFGDTAEQVASTHTVLELDTFKLMPSERLVTSYCVIDNLPLTEFPQLDYKKLNFNYEKVNTFIYPNYSY